MCSRRGGGLFIGDVRQYAFTYAREKRALHMLALARPVREREGGISFFLFLSLIRARFFRSPRRSSTFRRCIAALEMAYGIAYWSEGRARRSNYRAFARRLLRMHLDEARPCASLFSPRIQLLKRSPRSPPMLRTNGESVS